MSSSRRTRTTGSTPEIELLVPPVDIEDVHGLALLLVESVAAGEALSFLAPLAIEDAERWWCTQLDAAHPKAALVVARDAGAIVGAVLLLPAWAPNQPHRAEVVKLIVDARCRRSGLGTRLMRAVEAAAIDAGFTLLTLDAKRGAGADVLYEKLGWRLVGAIPGFAFDPDGVTPHDAVVFYKELRDANV